MTEPSESKKTYLITGGCGFLGSNIGAALLKQNKENVHLIILDNFYRLGSEVNYQWLRTLGDFDFTYGDIRSRDDVEEVIEKYRPQVIFHLAGQVAMTTSLQRPHFDFEINVQGSLNLLEALRKHSPESTLIYSSTNKVYGDLEFLSHTETETRYELKDYPQGVPETTPLEFHSPYGCSKGAADQYMLDYHRMFGLKTVVFRHSSMYGGRQFATSDQGWIGWFCQKALEQKADPSHPQPFTISGNGKQVRDLLFADDMVELYLKAAQRIEFCKGQAFNIGGGVHNSLSLLELLHFLEQELHIKLNYKKIPKRESDQRVFIADIRKAKEYVLWSPRITYQEGLRKMLLWSQESATKAQNTRN